jgi:hypothetical protein
MADPVKIDIKGGEKLAAALGEIAQKLGKSATLRVGFLENATYPDGTPVAMVAAIQEFGAPRAGIPPRPFFRTMVANKSPEWGKAIGDLLPAADYDADKVLNQAGAAIAGQLRQSIVDTNTPPLSPVTLMLRKMKSEGMTITKSSLRIARARLASGESVGGVSTKPLVETGHLLQSVDYEIKT